MNNYQRRPDERLGATTATYDLHGDQRVQFGRQDASAQGRNQDFMIAPFGSGTFVGNIPGPHSRENTVAPNHRQFIASNSPVMGYGENAYWSQ